MQYSQEHLKTMVYAKFGGQTECIMGNWKIENEEKLSRERGSLSLAINFMIIKLIPLPKLTARAHALIV